MMHDNDDQEDRRTPRSRLRGRGRGKEETVWQNSGKWGGDKQNEPSDLHLCFGQ